MTAAEFSMGQANGKPTEKLMDYYEERAKGGVGLIIPGICRVNDMYATSSFTQLAMSHDYHIEPMREFVGRIHRHGAKLGIQLHHPGRQGYASSVNSLPMILPLVEKKPEIMEMLYKATPTMMALEEKGICQPVAAPSVCERSYHVPSPMRAMTKFEVKRTIQDFIDAAVRCKKAGVDLVELHAAHGYLIQQFLSPNTNHRKDEYGGSFDNRLRFISEIITGIKAACGKDYPLMVRLSADEMYDRIGKPGKGYDLEEGKRIAEEEAQEKMAASVVCGADGRPGTRPVGAVSQGRVNTPSQAPGTPGQAVIDYACQFIGNPYVWGGTSLTNGADCSGFVQSVYAHFGVSLPRTTYDMVNSGYAVSYEEALPGDLILYDGHVGLYMGDGTIVNAMNEADGIGICSATYTDIIAVRRVL